MSRAHDRTSGGYEDEFEFIHWIRRQLADSPNIPVGVGDDCAALAMPNGSVALVTTDMVIEGVHFKLQETTPRQVGHKAIARGLSDIAAMAGEALAVVVAVAAPKHVSISFLQEMFRGMKATADACNAAIVGGDVATGELPLTLTVTAIGTGDEATLTLRSGARAGDVLLVTGDLGGAMLGRHLSFMPRLAEAQWLTRAMTVHAMIDISDGLAADANHIARESGMGIEIWEEAVPVSAAASKLAETAGGTPLEHALHDGEDYELLLTVAARDAEDALQRTDLPVRLTCIGDVVAGSGLWIRKRGADRRPLEPRGWTHKF